MATGIYLFIFAIVLILLWLVWWFRRRNVVRPFVRDPYTEALSYPYPVHYVSLPNGTEIAYVDEGSGNQTIVFVHGLGSYLAAWRRNIEGLKADYRCIALDLPNYGKSQPGDFPFTMTFFAETVASFIRQLGLRRVVLVGHSMGGQIAMTTVLNTDVKIEKLILVAPAGFEVFTPRDKRWMLGFFKPEVVSAATKEQVEQHLAANFSGSRTPYDARFMSADRLLMREYPDYLRSYARMIPKCTAAMLNEPVYDRMPQIDLPTLIIYGKEDLLIPNRFLHPGQTPAKVARDGHNRIPVSELTLIPSAGHFVMWEKARAVNEQIQQFLK
jgi:pimeloyl-ACP methyl ester carboxylesterase